MNMFTKGQKVKWIIYIMGSVADKAVRTVSKVTKEHTFLEEEPHLKFDNYTGMEVNPAISGCYSKIVHIKEKVKGKC